MMKKKLGIFLFHFINRSTYGLNGFVGEITVSAEGPTPIGTQCTFDRFQMIMVGREGK